MANVTHIFKKGLRVEVGNYRPVSLTVVTCKLMESIIRDRIVKHLLNNKLINPCQHGFTKAILCLTNLIYYLGQVKKLMDEGHTVDIIFCNFAKAFDKVPEMRLLEKLEVHGVIRKVLKWWGAG